MKWSWFGRAAMALLSALALGLSMTACGGGTIAYMWVIGQQYQQIIGFKVDQYTGNLTTIQNSPFSTNGGNPVYILVRPGGRYVYVINQGSTTSTTSNSVDSGIQAYAVGGDGSLTFQQSYQSAGYQHLWAQFDSAGTYLYVLDAYSPTGDGNGAITAFSSDPSTGRLVVQTQTASTPSGGIAPTFLEVGKNPLMMAGNNACLFTVNQADQSITPYAISGGQMTTVTTGKIFPGTTHATSINGNNTYMVLTDSLGVPSTTASAPNPGAIFGFNVSSGCSLTSFQGSPLQGLTYSPNASDPVYSFISASGKYIYVLNNSTTSTNTTTPYSSISAYILNTTANNELSPVAGQPFPAGSAPVCMVEDPTGQYVYISNHNGGTISGFTYTDPNGELSQLRRGSSFSTPDQQLGCLTISSVVD